MELFEIENSNLFFGILRRGSTKRRERQRNHEESSHPKEPSKAFQRTVEQDNSLIKEYKHEIFIAIKRYEIRL